MTKRDFFTVAIRLIGVFLRFNLLIATFTNIVATAPMLNSIYSLSGIALFLVFGAGIFAYAIVLSMIFAAPKLSDVLRLDRGFDSDSIDTTSLDARALLEAGIFLLGGWLFFYNLPISLSLIFDAVRISIAGEAPSAEQQGRMIIEVGGMVVGISMAMNFKWLARFMDRRN